MGIDGTTHIQRTGDMYVMDGKSFDMDTLIMTLQMQRSDLIDEMVRGQAEQMKRKQDALSQAHMMMSEARMKESNAQAKDPVTWSVDKENKTIQLDGYRIRLNEDSSEWRLEKLDGNGRPIPGEYTRVWGDPHVDEGDTGSSLEWNFKDNTTFILEDGTKISVGTAAWNDTQTISDSLTITKGDQCIRVTGLGQKTKGDLVISDVTQDGREADAGWKDGFIVRENGSVADWVTMDGTDLDSTANEDMWARDGSTNNNELEMGPKQIEMSQEMKQFFEANGVNIPDRDGDGKLSAAEWQDVVSNLKGFMDSMNSESQLDMIRMQSLINKRNQAFEMVSNALSKLNKPRETIISNMR